MFRYLGALIGLYCITLLSGCGAVSSTQSQVVTLTPSTQATRVSNKTVLSLLVAPTSSATPQSPTTTPVAGPVQGQVILANGNCCVGGTAGSTVSIEAAFSATSAAGPVTEMRVSTMGGCAKAGDLNQIAWEPFVTSKTFMFEHIPINWVGFYVSAQFRDDKGNVSAVACDDISVEGMP